MKSMGLRGELIVPCDRKRHFKPVRKRSMEARDGAQGPVDLGFAPTGAKRRRIEMRSIFESRIALE